jgi:hypothetical protein
MADVEFDAALAPVEDLPQILDSRRMGIDAEDLDAARHVAVFGMLDLDHLCAPVHEDLRGTRHECRLCDFHDADAFERFGHITPG